MNNNIYSLGQIRRQRTRKKRIIRLSIFCLVLIAGFLAHRFYLQPSTAVPLAKDYPDVLAVTNAFTAPPSVTQSSSLKAVVEKSLEGTQGTYSVVINNLKTGENYLKDDHRVFEAASLYKLWVMATVYQQIQQGKLKETLVLSQSIPTLNKKFSIDPESAEQAEGGITMSVNTALNQMITISHNYAALLLTEKIRLSTVGNWLKQNNFTESTVGTSSELPMTTAAETALFLEKIYKQQLVDAQSSQKMLELLKGQKLNGKLPKNLPPGTVVAHKTGELGWFSHDAGIIFTPKGDYIIVVMSESKSPKGAEERIAQLSKSVYDYFIRQ